HQFIALAPLEALREPDATLTDVIMKVIAQALREQVDLSQSRVDTLRQCEMHDLVRPSEWNGRFWLGLGQGTETLPDTTSEDKDRYGLARLNHWHLQKSESGLPGS